MKKIEAIIIADSKGINGTRLTTMLLTFPRFILSELNTHRVFSKNSASSRAIPFNKMVKMCEEDPFIPIAWQKDHSGMQGNEYFAGAEANACKRGWLYGIDAAIQSAKRLHNNDNVTKQLCNRMLEPFMWHTVLLTATEFDNFFELRCPKYLVGHFKSKKTANNAIPDLLPFGVHDEKDILWWLNANSSSAEIHMQALAEAMWDAMNESEPKTLFPGEWHIPYGDQIDNNMISQFGGMTNTDAKIKIASARCARLSYMTQDGKIDYQKDIELHNKLLESGHMSPFEHCARMMTKIEFEQDYIKLERSKKEYGWCNNFRGFIQYRHLIENK